MKETTIKAIDYFIPENYRNSSSPQDLWIYRCFSGIVLFIMFNVIVTYVMVLLGIFKSDFNFVLCIVLMLLCLVSFKLKGSLKLAVNFFCLTTFFIITRDTLKYGLIFSEGNIFLILIPIVSFIFSGTRHGVFWMFVVCFFLIFEYLESVGYFNFFPPSQPYFDPMFSLATTIQIILLVLGLLYIIFHSKSMVISQLEVNEERLREKARQLKEKTNELEQLKSQLIIRNDNLSKYAAVTAHDLKQPIRTITSFGMLLQEELNQNDSLVVQEYLNFIISGGEAMKEQVDKVLDIANLSEEIVYTKLDTKEVIEHTLQMLNSQIKTANASIEIQDLPPQIIANEVSIKKVFQNLISNGIKFNNKKDIKIEISGVETPLEWQFVIRDNGKGMEKEIQQKIFNFGERAKSNGIEGNGIGLNICKKLINLHRGKIWVNSSLEKGSEFFFSIRKNLQSI